MGKGKRYNKPAPGQSLAEVRPDLAECWHPSNPCEPEEISRGSSVMALWQCSRGHEFRRKVYDMVRDHAGCPTCKGFVRNPSHSVAAVNPRLADEWHPVLNGDVTPDDVSHLSERPVYWQCPMGHEFRLTPRARKSPTYAACPICTGRGYGPDLFDGLPGAEEEALSSRLGAPHTWLAVRRKEPRRVRVADLQCAPEDGGKDNG